VDSTTGIDGQLDSFRRARRDIEASVLPLATSVDGRRFTRTEVQIRYARGEGVIIDGGAAPFHDALVRAATETEVQAWQQRRVQSHVTLWLGDLALAAGVPCLADVRGFSRHTFLCGQSGSGKTYSLGVILERLLMETHLRVVVLDPNSDFVRLGRVRSGADPVLAGRYEPAAGRVAVYSAHAGGGRRAAGGGCGCTRPRSTRPPTRRRCAWIRSPTAMSMPRWPPSWPVRTAPLSRN
jgi:Helicase HerA, central domain